MVRIEVVMSAHLELRQEPYRQERAEGIRWFSVARHGISLRLHSSRSTQTNTGKLRYVSQ
jgi:hypothetical protein